MISFWIASALAGSARNHVPHFWAPAAKQAVGTAYEAKGAQSPLWFTLQSGILTEVYYPSIDQIQVGDLQLIVTDGIGFFSEQKRDVPAKVQIDPEGMGITLRGKDQSGAYEIHQSIVTESNSAALKIQTTLIPLKRGLRAFVLFKPAIANSGSRDLGRIENGALIATENHSSIFAAVVASTGWRKTSAGYVGYSDGWQDLSKNFVITEPAQHVGPGNIALTGELATDLSKPITFEIALAFGPSQEAAIETAQHALRTPFKTSFDRYQKGWKSYLDRLSLRGKERLSAAVIKMHEDKTERGAIIASMSTPAIPSHTRAPENNQGGYHLVWPRDLYHAAIGLLAAGDRQTPTDVLKFLRTRQKNDGSWHQNFYLDGRPYWKAVQMDQVAFPILLADMLRRHGYALSSSDLTMISKAADFIFHRGPTTEQDRWEEIGGYIPSSIAAQIAALRVASALLKRPHWFAKADEWSRQIENWTRVHQSQIGKDYYIRVSQSGNPDAWERFDIANGGGPAWNWELLDGGFLELVRLGVRAPYHPTVLSTLAIYDQWAPELNTHGIYRRYNRDAYGPHHQGGYWPVLAGERGEYALVARQWEEARSQLQALEASANETGLLPEQVMGFRKGGQPIIGDGAPCPLVWSHAEHLRLARGLRDKKVFDMPEAVTKGF